MIKKALLLKVLIIMMLSVIVSGGVAPDANASGNHMWGVAGQVSPGMASAWNVCLLTPWNIDYRVYYKNGQFMYKGRIKAYQSGWYFFAVPEDCGKIEVFCLGGPLYKDGYATVNKNNYTRNMEWLANTIYMKEIF